MDTPIIPFPYRKQSHLPYQHDWSTFCSLNNVPKMYENANVDSITFRNFDSKMGEKALDWAKNPCSLILEGKSGTGKTYFTHVLMRLLIQRIPMGYMRFIRSKDLDDKFVKSYKDFGNSLDVLETFQGIEFLFIDDFGILRSSETAQRDWYDLIDYRTAHEKITVFSTNLSPNEIQNLFGSRIASRLNYFKIMRFHGEDLRERF